LDASAELRQRFILLDSEVLVLQSPPEPFHPGVVPASAPAIHADSDAIRLELIRELLAGELAALIRIEDFLNTAVIATGIFALLFFVVK
jgi:hypothetical protein